MKKVKLQIKNYKLKRDDEVKVMLGKDSGKTGKIIKIDRKTGKALVEGVNMVKRHVRSMRGVEGGIVDIAKPVNLSNLQIVCSKCKKITRIGYKIESDKKIRVCRKCGEAI